MASTGPNVGSGSVRNSIVGSVATLNVKTEAVASPTSHWAISNTQESKAAEVSSLPGPLQSNSINTNTSQPQKHAVDKRRLHDLISEVDPFQQVDEDAESCLLDIADDFIDTVLAAACQVAKHRKSTVLEVKDVQYVLDNQFNLWMPGFAVSSDAKQSYKRPAPTDAHKQRMAIIRKLFKTH